jgi:hypothetical protein
MWPLRIQFIFDNIIGGLRAIKRRGQMKNSVIISFLTLFLGHSISVSGPADMGFLYFMGKGRDSYLATGPQGQAHIAFGGKYRGGSSVYAFGDVKIVTDTLAVFGIPRITVDGSNRPHIVFQKGWTNAATTSWYTRLVNNAFTTPEKFADGPALGGDRAYIPDVAVDNSGNVCATFYCRDRPYYRWRSASGTWGSAKYISGAHWSTTPKVESYNNQFYFMYQAGAEDWKIAGPVSYNGTFSGGVSVGSQNLQGVSNIQNEGGNFLINKSGKIAAASNVREAFSGPVGVWAADNFSGSFSARYLGSFQGTVRGDESGLHPNLAYDEETGNLYVAVRNPKDYFAYFNVRVNGNWLGWKRALPEYERRRQGTLRSAASLADIPGPGVAICVNDSNDTYVRIIGSGNLEARVKSLYADRIVVEFSEVVTSASAENTGNYTIQGVSVTGAVLDNTGKAVELTLDGQTVAVKRLIINNVETPQSKKIPETWLDIDFKFTVNRVTAINKNQVSVIFNLPADRTTAETNYLYTIWELGIFGVTGATLKSDELEVILDVKDMTVGTEYSLEIQNVKDKTGKVMDPFSVTFTYTGDVGVVSDYSRSEEFGIEVWPNPFNTSTNIRVLMRNAECRMINLNFGIYDIHGRFVGAIGRGGVLTKNANNLRTPPLQRLIGNSYTWDATNHPSGIYFLKIKTGDRIYTRQVTRVD